MIYECIDCGNPILEGELVRCSECEEPVCDKHSTEAGTDYWLCVVCYDEVALEVNARFNR